MRTWISRCYRHFLFANACQFNNSILTAVFLENYFSIFLEKQNKNSENPPRETFVCTAATFVWNFKFFLHQWEKKEIFKSQTETSSEMLYFRTRKQHRKKKIQVNAITWDGVARTMATPTDWNKTDWLLALISGWCEIEENNVICPMEMVYISLQQPTYLLLLLLLLFNSLDRIFLLCCLPSSRRWSSHVQQINLLYIVLCYALTAVRPFVVCVYVWLADTKHHDAG